MCVAAIAWNAHPDWKLVMIGNRDEFHARPAAPIARWDGEPLIAGRDLEAGGTWLGISPGRFALVTNRRAEGYPRAGLASRGALVCDWLRGNPPGGATSGGAPSGGAGSDDVRPMNPFNLWLANYDQLMFVTNHPGPAGLALDAGVHGLSNGPREDRWFKTARLEQALSNWLDRADPLEALLAALADQSPDPAQPDNPLSAVFIAAERYGTRCSTVIGIDAAGQGVIIERSFAMDGSETGTVRLDFLWS